MGRKILWKKEVSTGRELSTITVKSCMIEQMHILGMEYEHGKDCSIQVLVKVIPFLVS